MANKASQVQVKVVLYLFPIISNIFGELLKLIFCVCSETVELYSKEVRALCNNLLKYIAMSLGLRQQAFEEMFGVAVQAIRMNYYPACSRPDLVLGLSPHSDGSALTVLQQGKGSSVGLQILKDNTWVPVQPIPNALVINIGDTIEVIDLKSYVYLLCQNQYLN